MSVKICTLSKKFLIFLTVSLIFVACSSPSSTDSASSESTEEALNFPEKPISLIVPYGAGGSMDTIARGLAEVGEKYFDQPITVVNREGASGTIATEEVANAKPDGYTVLLTSGAILTVQPHLKDLNYELSDFKMLSSVVYNPLLLMGKLGSPYQSVKDIIEHAEKEDVTFKIGHPGVGTSNDIAHQALFSSLGLDASMVPFQANSESLAAIIGDHIDFAAVHPIEATSFIEDKQLKALGVFTPDPYEKMPEVPTIAESVAKAGLEFPYKDHDFSSWYYLVVPKDTSDDIAEYLQEKFKQVIEDPDFEEYANKLNMTIRVLVGDEMEQTLQNLEETNKEIIKKVGIGGEEE